MIDYLECGRYWERDKILCESAVSSIVSLDSSLTRSRMGLRVDLPGPDKWRRGPTATGATMFATIEVARPRDRGVLPFMALPFSPSIVPRVLHSSLAHDGLESWHLAPLLWCVRRTGAGRKLPGGGLASLTPKSIVKRQGSFEKRP